MLQTSCFVQYYLFHPVAEDPNNPTVFKLVEVDATSEYLCSSYHNGFHGTECPNSTCQDRSSVPHDVVRMKGIIAFPSSSNVNNYTSPSVQKQSRLLK